jgi:hypothetical protein
MVDMSPVLELLRKGHTISCPHGGTKRGQANSLTLSHVPAVPTVPSKNTRPGVPSAADALERAAILEFCEGLPRQEADARALSEAGFGSWEELAIALGASRV